MQLPRQAGALMRGRRDAASGRAPASAGPGHAMRVLIGRQPRLGRAPLAAADAAGRTARGGHAARCRTGRAARRVVACAVVATPGMLYFGYD
jgi:hypothetical protein